MSGSFTSRPAPASAVLALVFLLFAGAEPYAGESRSHLTARSESAVDAVRPADGAAQSDDVAAMERRLLERINLIRRSHGLDPLQADESLTRIARGYSFRMNRFGFFGHFDPAGNDVADRLRGEGIRFAMVAENIAKNINFSDPVETAVDGWMNSDGHRENILTPEFRLTGVGIWKDGSVYHFTQVFMEPWQGV